MHDTDDNKHHAEFAKLEAQLQETIEERDDVYDANNSLSDAYDELEQKVRELESTKSASESFVKAQAELVELRGARQTLESKIDQQNRELELLQSELKTLSEVKENNSDLRMKIESMAGDADLTESLRSELTEANSRIEDLRQTRLALESKLEQQKQETELLQSELKSLSEVKENNSDLRLKIESMAGDTALIESLRGELTEAKLTIEELKATKAELLLENEKTGEKLIEFGEVQKTNRQLSDQIATLQSTTLDLKAQAEKGKQLENEIHQLRGSNATLVKKSESLEKQVVSLSEVERKIAVANDQISELQRENSELTTSVDDARQKIAKIELVRDQSASEIANLQATSQVQQVRFDAEKSAFVRQIESQQETLAEQQELSADLKSTRNRLEVSQQQIVDYELQLTDAKNQSDLLKSADEDRAKLADQLVHVNDEQRMLRQSVIRDSARLVDQEKQIKQLKGLESSLRKTLELEKSSISSKETELAEAKKVVRTLRAKARQQSEQLMLDLGDERGSNRKPKTTTNLSPTKSRAADDLSKIEGIGPKIKSVLVDNGIKTFRKLAATKVTRLEKILSQAGPSFSRHKPSTWPEQARLAADEKWEALNRLQEKLQGGRRK